MAIASNHFRKLIVRPAIEKLGLWSASAEELLMLTWAQETHGATYLKQGWKRIDDARGVGLGPYSMEPATHDDHWTSFLRYHPMWRAKLAWPFETHPPAERMVGDLIYATQMARFHYWRVKELLPPFDRIDQLAIYWDKHFNRNPNAGFPSEAVANYKTYV